MDKCNLVFFYILIECWIGWIFLVCLKFDCICKDNIHWLPHTDFGLVMFCRLPEPIVCLGGVQNPKVVHMKLTEMCTDSFCVWELETGFYCLSSVGFFCSIGFMSLLLWQIQISSRPIWTSEPMTSQCCLF